MPDTDKPNVAPGLAQIGSYRIIEQLGTGGMSSVFRAVHVETGHEVALKVLPRSLAKNATLLQRFLREARSAESLEHPNIVAIFDRGTEQGRYYLVLEFIAGGDLHDRVRNRGPLGVAEAVGIIRGVVQGLRFAAGLGLIHRDIKPANILLTDEGQPKVADLGLAVQLDEEDERVTRDGTTVGTVDYMAPEQARDSRATSVRSDIYSLGCTFYHVLTGFPPFAGGDVTDKLRRHASEPPPDVRRARPDVPEELAGLIQRMMAKRPEARFRDYDELTNALNALPLPRDEAEPESLYALIDDEAEAEVQVVGSKPEVPLGSTAEGTALRPPVRGPVGKPAPPVDDAISLADLADLDDDDPAYRVARPRLITPAPTRPAALDDDEWVLDGPRAVPVHRSDDTTLRDMILRGVMIGLAIVLVGFGISQLIRLQMATRETQPAPEVAAEPEAEPEVTGPIPPLTPARPEPKDEPAPAPVAVAWVEPSEPSPGEDPAEPTLPEAIEAQCLPDWTKVEPALDGSTVLVRRLEHGRGHAMSLTRALDSIGGTAVIADRGPFFEAITRFGSKPKRVQARPGTRAVVVIEAPSTVTAARGRSALFVLEGPDLLLEGLDLVVPLGEFPSHVTALFQCRSGCLTLRDCTLTIVGPPERPFTAFRLGDGGPTPADGAPRLRLERTLLQGQAMTLIEFSGRAGRAWLSRSVALCGASSAVAISPVEGLTAPRSRELLLHRSILAERRSAIDASRAGAGNAPLVVRAAGSTLARVQGGGATAPLIETRGGAPRSLVDWSGDANVFAGWSGWLSNPQAPNDPASRLDDLSAARALWRSDEASQEQYSPWPDPQPGDWTRDDLEARARDALGTTRRVAWREPRVLLDTVATYPTLEAAGPPAAPSTARALAFDANDPRWGGDLGRFLAAQELEGVTHLAVEVRGQGEHALTPIRLPDGVGLSIVVPPPVAGVAPLSWSLSPGDPPAPAFLVRRAPLSLDGVRLRSTSPEPLVVAEDGDLRLSRCVLLGPAPVDPRAPESSLVRFRASSSQALGLPAEGDRPEVPATPLTTAILTDCVLIAPGAALRAEVACGVVGLRNCAVVGAASAIVLDSLPVARDRFRADLQLDRTTIAAGRGFIRLGPWPGSPAGPARPWLVSSNRTAYLDAFDHTSGNWRERPVLLRANPEALACGALSWQSVGDDYQVSGFLAPDDAPSASNVRPDVQRDWVRFWGAAHIGRVHGPVRGIAAPGVHLRVGRLKPGSLTPDDLALEAPGPNRSRPVDIGADLSWLGATAPPGPRAAPGGPDPGARPRSPAPLRRLDAPLPF
jgi:serine/threonine-protein kinase